MRNIKRKNMIRKFSEYNIVNENKNFEEYTIKDLESIGSRSDARQSYNRCYKLSRFFFII